MDDRYSGTDWIAAYFEWADAGPGTLDRAPIDPLAAAADEDTLRFVDAYLDWMDARRPAIAPLPPSGNIALAAAKREVILLAALRAQSNCIRVLRRVLDGGQTAPYAVGLACETIEYTHKLLEDGQLLPLRL